MGNKDVRDALIKMEEDEGVRAQLAEGDFSGVSDLELSSEERTLVQDAANDMPDVAGFASDYLLELDGVKGESKSFVKIDFLYSKIDSSQFQKFQAAYKYSANKKI